MSNTRAWLVVVVMVLCIALLACGKEEGCRTDTECGCAEDCLD